jgi:hypothetical protein
MHVGFCMVGGREQILNLTVQTVVASGLPVRNSAEQQQSRY